jgi:hypothetical protein
MTSEQALRILSRMARIATFTDPEFGKFILTDAELRLALGTILRHLADGLSDGQIKTQRRRGFSVDRVSKGNYRAKRSKT